LTGRDRRIVSSRPAWTTYRDPVSKKCVKKMARQVTKWKENILNISI
jgi:hypothetical protein